MPHQPGTRPDWVPSDLYPFEDRWAEIDGNTVHYVDEGDGPTLLLLNGNPSWSFGWRHVIKQLRDRFRCIAPDYPGFGLSVARRGYDFRPVSHARVIEELVDRLGLDAVTVFGSDWGGPIGYGLAGRRPERIRALVVGNTWAWPADRATFRLFSTLVGGPLGGLLVDRLNIVLRVLLPAGLKRRKLNRTELRAYHRPFPPGARRPMRVFPREILGSRAYLRWVEANLPKLADKPVLILWPDGDFAFQEPELRRWQSTFPNARTVTLQNVGHYLEEDAPDQIAAAIGAWWVQVVMPGTAHP